MDKLLKRLSELGLEKRHRGILGGVALLAGLPVRALYVALLEWSRAAELSCDRAAAIVVGDPRITWVATGDFDRIAGGSYTRRGQEPPVSAQFDAAVTHYRERFTAMIDRTVGGVNKLADQVQSWLRRDHSQSADQDGEEEGDS